MACETKEQHAEWEQGHLAHPPSTEGLIETNLRVACSFSICPLLNGVESFLGASLDSPTLTRS